ncbi:hypothetical protein HPP92_024682 [Vanilla planifolia]|uniref:Uncharacterized protein n=1 Tax=Vanilla planifolia TaxID=51239 RepID=A0A835PL74_VANPL|nr:hypothetical protein HPP92_024682 [Vanilla planifolia]
MMPCTARTAAPNQKMRIGDGGAQSAGNHGCSSTAAVLTIEAEMLEKREMARRGPCVGDR